MLFVTVPIGDGGDRDGAACVVVAICCCCWCCGLCGVRTLILHGFYASNGAGNGWVSVAHLDCLSLVACFRLWVWLWCWWIMLLIHYGFLFFFSVGFFLCWIFQFKTLHLNTFFFVLIICFSCGFTFFK